MFLVIAIGLFLVQKVFNPAAGRDDNPRVITIDREVLLRFAQFRNRVFDEQAAGARFDAMTPVEKKQLLNSLIREEALYREALSWGLDKEDYVIRRRLVQSLEFSLGGDTTAPGALDEKALRDYYAANRERYAEPPTVSFTHVFFSSSAGGEERARARATAALGPLNAGRIDPGSTGDRFLYHVNYAHQGRDMIRSHFGDEMAAQLFALEPQEKWQGPFASPYGVHLVRLTAAAAGGVPAFESIRELVARDAAQAAARERQEQALDRIVAGYRVNVSSDLEDLR
jgi:hypothetical protein